MFVSFDTMEQFLAAPSIASHMFKVYIDIQRSAISIKETDLFRNKNTLFVQHQTSHMYHDQEIPKSSVPLIISTFFSQGEYLFYTQCHDVDFDVVATNKIIVNCP